MQDLCVCLPTLIFTTGLSLLQSCRRDTFASTNDSIDIFLVALPMATDNHNRVDSYIRLCTHHPTSTLSFPPAYRTILSFPYPKRQILSTNRSAYQQYIIFRPIISAEINKAYPTSSLHNQESSTHPSHSDSHPSNPT
jgi:hypothetical protein